ncbi:hypothetical protein CHARACLAT_032972 [Characodon lateralis]|uniref:Uncharacterized protein n=1 Tax=Characodon lateralis TaxID=208331 RepID=A0ABU7D4J0_9TELE|nr:hypothetical protein [Characodon lateralis]
MKKITGFKQKDDQTDGGLDRANELNTFFNRFSSETSSASSSPAHSQTDIPPSFEPQPLCHTSNVLSSTSAMDPSALHVYLQPYQKMLMLPLPPPSTCVSQEVR